MDNFVTTLFNLQKLGGTWLGKTREWMQSNIKGGDRLTWESSEPVSVTFSKLQELGAVGAAAQAVDIRNSVLEKFLIEAKDLHNHIKEFEENQCTQTYQELLLMFGKLKGISESVIICYNNDPLPPTVHQIKEELEDTIKVFLQLSSV